MTSPGNIASFIRTGAAMGRSPAEVKAMTMAEFMAAFEGFMAAQGAAKDDGPSDDEVMAALAEELGA